ncbi:hypothetical protein [Streptomyces sp. NPDC020983]|uniref:hypothetical protein n=1 Tax=Streptomyces sp. NPDC020983 TaxID=3365106 RepID=UPI0037B5DCC4
MTALDDAVDALITALRRIADPVKRYEAAKDLESRVVADVKQVKAEVAQELHPQHTWKEVGELLGVTGSRAEQISRASR